MAKMTMIGKDQRGARGAASAAGGRPANPAQPNRAQQTVLKSSYEKTFGRGSWRDEDDSESGITFDDAPVGRVPAAARPSAVADDDAGGDEASDNVRMEVSGGNAGSFGDVNDAEFDEQTQRVAEELAEDEDAGEGAPEEEFDSDEDEEPREEDADEGEEAEEEEGEEEEPPVRKVDGRRPAVRKVSLRQPVEELDDESLEALDALGYDSGAVQKLYRADPVSTRALLDKMVDSSKLVGNRGQTNAGRDIDGRFKAELEKAGLTDEVGEALLNTMRGVVEDSFAREQNMALQRQAVATMDAWHAEMSKDPDFQKRYGKAAPSTRMNLKGDRSASVRNLGRLAKMAGMLIQDANASGEKLSMKAALRQADRALFPRAKPAPEGERGGRESSGTLDRPVKRQPGKQVSLRPGRSGGNIRSGGKFSAADRAIEKWERKTGHAGMFSQDD